ncbi:MAG: hypothetical protein ABFD89_18385 [Bryobacteraceae bacterium]
MAGTTTAMCSSFKRDLLNGLHRFAQSRTFTATGASTATWTAVSALTGLAVGQFLSGTNVAAGSRIADILSSTSIFVSKASTGALGTITAIGDTFKIALIKVSPTGTYGAASVSYADITGNSDEVTGTGYTAGGTALTNTDPSLSTTTALTDFADVSWTTATFSATAAMIYNTTQNGPQASPSVSTHDFGGTQTVTAGTFTLVFPTPDASNAILRIA